MRLSLLARWFKRSSDKTAVEAPADPSAARDRPERMAVRAPLAARTRGSPPPSSSARRPPVPIEPVAVEEPQLPPFRPPSKDETPVRATPMPAQEEVSLKLSEGMKSLSNLLGSIDDKLGEQRRHGELLVERLQALPRVLEGIVETQRLNLEALRQLKTAVDEQSESSRQAGAKLDSLPTLLNGIGGRIEKQTEAAAAVRTSVDGVGQSMRGLVDAAQRTQSSLVTEFRRGQDEQRQRLELLVERQRRTLYWVSAIVALVVLGLIAVLFKLPRT